MPRTGIAALFKSALYGQPYPLFVWNSGDSEENIWTAASLYWALVEIDKETSTHSEKGEQRFPCGLDGRVEVTYARFPRLLWLAARASVTVVAEDESDVHSVLIFENPIHLKWIDQLPNFILRNSAQEYHFVAEGQNLTLGFPPASVRTYRSSPEFTKV